MNSNNNNNNNNNSNEIKNKHINRQNYAYFLIIFWHRDFKKTDLEL